jgi:GT2 family glycosyltransferase
MDNESKRLIFDYCGWNLGIKEYCEECDGWVEPNHPLDGNDILEAVKIMEERGGFGIFRSFVYYYNWLATPDRYFEPYLLQNFFTLLAAWLKERKA